MIRSAVDKVMWVGRTTVFLVGLIVILALAFAVVNAVLGASGGPSLSGKFNQIDSGAQFAGGAGEQALALEPLARRRMPTQGYAQVLPTCSSGTPSVCQFEDARAVKGVTRVEASNSDPDGEKSVYCFDLAFIPHIAVASAYWNNAALVSTGARDDVPPECPAPYVDAGARTYESSTSFDNDEVGFAIEFR